MITKADNCTVIPLTKAESHIVERKNKASQDHAIVQQKEYYPNRNLLSVHHPTEISLAVSFFKLALPI